MLSAAQGLDLGDLFEYKLKDRVTIHKNESSLVPIVQAHVQTEKVSLWNPSLGSARPLRALWLTNSSPLTLDGGSFSVLEDEAFAGEGLMDPVKPGEKRLVSYAADLGIRVDKKTHGEPQRVTKVRIIHGTMIQTSATRQDTIYTARNEDSVQRALLIEHALRPGWNLSTDTPKPEETTATDYRFRLPLGAKATTTLVVTESSAIESRYALTNIDDGQIQVFLQQKSINPEVEAAFRKIVEQKNHIAASRCPARRNRESARENLRRPATHPRKPEVPERQLRRARPNPALHPAARRPGNPTPKTPNPNHRSPIPARQSPRGPGRHDRKPRPGRNAIGFAFCTAGLRPAPLPFAFAVAVLPLLSVAPPFRAAAFALLFICALWFRTSGTLPAP